MLKQILIGTACIAGVAMADEPSLELDAAARILRGQFAEAKVDTVDRYLGKWELVKHKAYGYWRLDTPTGEWRRDDSMSYGETYLTIELRRSGKLVVGKQVGSGDTSYYYYALTSYGLVGIVPSGYGYTSLRIMADGTLIGENITPAKTHEPQDQALGPCEIRVGESFYRYKAALGDKQGCAESYLSSF